MAAVTGKGLHTDVVFVVRMDCRHEILFKVGEPTAGESLWCTKCYSYQIALHVAGKYGARCENCHYARNYGGQLTARTKATAHSLRRIGHKVIVCGPDDFYEEFSYQVQAQQIDFDLPPF